MRGIESFDAADLRYQEVETLSPSPNVIPHTANGLEKLASSQHYYLRFEGFLQWCTLH